MWYLLNAASLIELEEHKWELMLDGTYEKQWMAITVQYRIDQLLKFRA